MSSRELFAKSAFAHGYIHGYEEGFHRGDLDLQMGRPFREVKSQQEYKKPAGYHEQFGDKDEFKRGYQYGYQVGYTDCYVGRTFRAEQLLKVTEPKTPGHPAPTFDRKFDTAFREGYNAGRQQGLADGRVSEVSRVNLSACGPSAGHEAAFAGYCDAFRDGFQLGYSDGFTNQKGNAEVVARNRGDQ